MDREGRRGREGRDVNARFDGPDEEDALDSDALDEGIGDSDVRVGEGVRADCELLRGEVAALNASKSTATVAAQEPDMF